VAGVDEPGVTTPPGAAGAPIPGAGNIIPLPGAPTAPPVAAGGGAAGAGVCAPDPAKPAGAADGAEPAPATGAAGALEAEGGAAGPIIGGGVEDIGDTTPAAPDPALTPRAN
jgi:hypothetical protein